MGYNYASAFLEQEDKTIDEEFAKEICMTALLNYRDEFPDVEGHIHVDIFVEDEIVKVDGPLGVRKYTLEELGFKI